MNAPDRDAATTPGRKLAREQARKRHHKDLLREVDEWLNTPQHSGGGHIAVHAALCPDLARRVREALS